MKQNRKNTSFEIILLFMAWPFLGFIISLFKMASKYSALIFSGFCALAGYFFKLSNSEYDSYRYAQDFINATNFGIQDYLEYQQQMGMIDFYSLFSYVFISLFSTDPHILFAFWGAVFGYFAYKSLLFAISAKDKQNYMQFTYLIITIMFLINPYININGVRFWTAVWVFFAGWLGYEIHNKKKWLLVMCTTPLIHTTFLIPLIVFVIYRSKLSISLKYLYFTYIFLFILGYVVDVEIIVKYIPFLNLSERYSTYVDIEYITSRFEQDSQRSFLNTLLSEMPNYFILVFITWLYTSKKMFKYNQNDVITKILKYTLVLLCICSITQSIPSMGRFDKLCHLLILTILLLYKERGDITTPYISPIILFVFWGKIYNIWFIHNNLISLKYLYPFAYLF